MKIAGLFLSLSAIVIAVLAAGAGYGASFGEHNWNENFETNPPGPWRSSMEKEHWDDVRNFIGCLLASTLIAVVPSLATRQVFRPSGGKPYHACLVILALIHGLASSFLLANYLRLPKPHWTVVFPIILLAASCYSMGIFWQRWQAIRERHGD